MRIEFRHISIEGFLSIGKAEIDLVEKGLTLVSGINTNPNDNSQSNGSGKSSIFEAIFYAATGYTIRGNKDIVNRNYPLGCKLELTIARGDDEFKIIRTRNHHEQGTKVQLLMNEEDISGKTMKDCDAVIKQYIPELAWNVISSVIVLGQGLPNKLTNYTPSGRKQLLEDLSQTSHLIEEVRARLDTRKYNQDSELKDLTSRVSQLNVETTTLERVIKDIRSRMTYTVEEIDADIFKYIDQLNAFIAQAEQLKSDEEFFIELLLTKNRQKGEISSTYNQLYYRQKDLESKIQKLSNNICPTCGRLLDNSEELAIEKSNAQIELEKISSEMKTTKATMDSIETEISEIMQSKSGVSLERNKVDAEVINLNGKLDTLNSTKAVIVSAEEDIKKHTSRIDEINDELKIITPKQDELNLSLNSLGYLDRALSKEFKSYLLENVIEYLNKKLAKYAEILFSSGYIKLVSSGNNLDVVVGSKSYESLSGGERQKADLCIQFAIRDMLVNVTGFNSNILVLDEVFDNLDEVGCTNLLRLISQLFTDIDSVFIITHHSDIPIPFDNKITVIKDLTNLSRVVEEGME